MTKHEQILAHISALQAGEKISVRKIAKQLKVSEGTAYRAIKEAEERSIVSTIPRVGTVRVAQKVKKQIDHLTFSEVVDIVDGHYLGGANGKHKHLDKFVIGAMEETSILGYIEANSLMIVGNRLNVQMQALQHGAAILITGGFDTTREIKALADDKALPIISTSYDSFTVATMINQALRDRQLKKDILLIEDIMTPRENTVTLYPDDTIGDYERLVRQAQYTHIPVVTQYHRLVGIVTPKVIAAQPKQKAIHTCMIKDVLSTKKEMSVATVAHQMIAEHYHWMPVVEDDFTLVGVVSTEDIMTSIHHPSKGIEATWSDQLMDELYDSNIPLAPVSVPHTYETIVTLNMINHEGVISFGIMCELLVHAARRQLYQHTGVNIMVESLNVHFLKLVQVDSHLVFCPRILEESRQAATVDIEVYVDNTIVSKALLVCHLIQKQI